MDIQQASKATVAETLLHQKQPLKDLSQALQNPVQRFNCNSQALPEQK